MSSAEESAPQEGTSASKNDSSIEERVLYIKKQRKILRAKVTRTINRIKTLIDKKTESTKRLGKEINDVKTDFSNISVLHGELYEYTSLSDHDKLDDWEAELIQDIYDVEDQVDNYVASVQSETISDDGLEPPESTSKSYKGQKAKTSNFEKKSEKSVVDAGQLSQKSKAKVETFDSWIGDLSEFEETVSEQLETMTIAEALYKLEAAKDMPNLTLSKFDGDPLKYVDFMERFKIHIHQKPHLSDEMRLAQLRMLLCGEAERSVAGLGSDGMMYATVLKQLRDEYGQPSCIARAHIRRIVNGPKVTNRVALKELSLDILNCIATLKRINSFADINASEMLRKLISRLPNNLIERWKNEVTKLRERDETPSITHISEMIRRRVKAEFDPDFGDIDKPSESMKTQGSSQQSHNVRKGIHAEHIVRTCAICEKTGHRPFECQMFLGKSVAERVQLVQSNRLCFSCLHKGHISKKCRYKKACGENGCSRTHNKLLHSTPPNTSSVTSVLDYSSMLPVVRGIFRAPNGRVREGNILIDGGAGTTVIRKQFARALGLQGKSENLDLCVVGGSTVQQPQSRRVQFFLSPLSGGEEHAMEAFEIDHTIGDVPSLDKPWLKTFRHLSDLDFSAKAGHIDLILGVQYSHFHAEDEIREGLAFEPVAKKSRLGWYVMGADNVRQISPVCAVQVIERVDLQKMYDFETVGIQAPDCDCPREIFSSEDRKAMGLLESSCEKVGDRYRIGLPWKRNPEELPNNYSLAERRLLSLEKSLKKDEEKAECYQKAVKESETKGWAVRIDSEEINDTNHPVYYLPHHGVHRPDKSSTPLRVVFDPACEFQGTSLNSFLFKGPSLIGNLYGVLIRFREDYTAIVGDISKMYLQILLPERDTQVHRFLWRDLDQSRDPDVYRLLRVTFGDKPSPDMASFVMLQIAKEYKDVYPEAALVLERDRYMDDLIHSCSTSDEARERIQELNTMLSSGSFKIKQWYSSSQNVRDTQQSMTKVNQGGVSLDGEEIKTLGIRWDPASDNLKFSVKDVELMTFTKRSVLSKLSMLYDPLGLAIACTISARMALQDLWRSRLEWDEKMPENMSNQWTTLFAEIAKLETVSLPRCLKPPDALGIPELHVFVDASLKAYGAVAFQKWDTPSGPSVRLVSAKGRVAPLHQTTIPRLELMAALIGSRLASTLCSELKTKPNVTLWTDSQIVLHWLKAESIKLKQFVGVRVAEIQSQWRFEQWRFVPSQLNPADDLSRGITVEQIYGRWMNGPEFLKLPPEEWPTNPTKLKIDERQLEMKSVKTVGALKFAGPIVDPEKFSSWGRLVRVTAYCFKFVNKLKCASKRTNQQGETSQRDEIRSAEMYLVGIAQNSFKDWEKDLLSLSPFQSENIIRVGGRLRKSSLEYDQTHPIVLPAKHHISKLIMRDYHVKLCHVGPERTLCESRRKFWIVKGRNMAKSIVRDCVICRKLRQPAHSTFMADLPADRLKPFAPPFTVTGVDLFGPFKLKYGRNKSVKAWGAIFTCATTRAVHLEIVADLSTQAFLQSLRRFAAHHGWPETIISDNGTSFVGANRELKTIVKNGRKQIEDYAMLHQVNWRFITPHSPHQGGLYESLIKQVKKAIQVVVGQQLLSWNDMSTVYAEVECLLNSRPLGYLSDDPNDPSPLTPNHFLLGRATNEVPQGPYQETKNLHKRFEFVQSLVQQVWKMFLREYVPTLMKRVKWQSHGRQMCVGDVVLLVDFTAPRGKWEMARKVQVFPGSDGVVRNVKVETKSSEYQRSVQKCVLLLENRSD